MSLGSFDFSEFKAFADKLDRAVKADEAMQFKIEVMQEIANRFLALTKEKTPVGQYDDGWVEFTTKEGEDVRFWASAHGKQGGLLRRNWEITNVTPKGKNLLVTLFNNTYYAGWVNNGHRLVNGSWLEGQFFLELSLEEIEQIMPKLVGKRYEEFMKKIFD